MAKKSKMNASVGAAAALPDVKPRLWVDVEKGDMDILNDMTVGKTVVVAVKGKVVAVAKRENEYEGEGKTVKGEFQLENYEVELMTMNDFEALSDD